MKVAKNVLVGLPADVSADLDAVCPPGQRLRTTFIVAAIREKLADEPVVQRAREQRAAAAKEKRLAGEELTPEEEAHMRHAFEQLRPRLRRLLRGKDDTGND